jgi:hypothetical protein
VWCVKKIHLSGQADLLIGFHAIQMKMAESIFVGHVWMILMQRWRNGMSEEKMFILLFFGTMLGLKILQSYMGT